MPLHQGVELLPAQVRVWVRDSGQQKEKRVREMQEFFIALKFSSLSLLASSSRSVSSSIKSLASSRLAGDASDMGPRNPTSIEGDEKREFTEGEPLMVCSVSLKSKMF